jgi:hypothetical protein
MAVETSTVGAVHGWHQLVHAPKVKTLWVLLHVGFPGAVQR